MIRLDAYVPRDNVDLNDLIELHTKRLQRYLIIASGLEEYADAHRDKNIDISHAKEDIQAQINFEVHFIGNACIEYLEAHPSGRNQVIPSSDKTW